MASKTRPVKGGAKKAARPRHLGQGQVQVDRGSATFPYTTRPGALRRFLGLVPNRPRPTRVNRDLLASWELAGSENLSIVRVLKAVGLLNENNEPNDNYTAFMRAGTGPGVLAGLIRRTYAPLFQAVHHPQREGNEALQNLFNIHSGGGTIELQIQTFRALSDSADFDAESSAAATQVSADSGAAGRIGEPPSERTQGSSPAIHIDLHIHLPPGKSSRDYQYIIQDIAKYLYGVDGSGDARADE